MAPLPSAPSANAGLLWASQRWMHVYMDLPKMFHRKAAQDMDQPEKADKARPAKKSGLPVAKTKKSEPAKKVTKKPEDSGPPFWQRSREYVRDVVYELRKVVWPSRKETVGTTVVVLVLVILSSVYFGVVDFFLTRVIRVLLG